MRKANLKRIFRGSAATIEHLVALVGHPVRIEDESGKTLFGAATLEGERHPVFASGAHVGVVIGPPAAARIADVLAHLVEREDEKLALADETLGRYKELTLIYDMSDKLSRVLDVKEVAELVVDEAKRFLKATTATLLTVDRRREVLEPIASTDERARSRLLAVAGVEGRVLRNGRAEFVEDASISDAGSAEPGVCALVCAPLRSGETVFGILRVTNTERATWTAGHLKLVTSLASNAGAAMSRAMLHGERLRQQALRHQISHFASPVLLEAAFSGRTPEGPAPAVALFCDVGELARFADVGSNSEELTALVRQATAIALDAAMREGATVQVANREMLVGLFADERGRREAAEAAVRTAKRIVRALDRRFGGIAARSPAVAVTHADLPDARSADVFFSAVGAAANLQRQAEGRILVDEEIARALGGDLQIADGLNDSAYEVPA